jgi:UDP-glucose 4-epimerase
MDILLAGATGFIGSHLRAELAQRHHVFALTRHRGFTDDKDWTWIQADLSDPTNELVVPGKVDAVVWLAQSPAYREFPERAWDVFVVNVGSVMMLLEYARQSRVKLFIFASSANVYPTCHGRISESCPPAPTSFYARSKRIAELLAESYAAYFRCLILRLFTVYGPGQMETLIPELIERVRQDRPIAAPGNSGLKLTPVYVTDVCKVIQAALETEEISPGFEILNVGGDEALNIRQMGLIIGDVLGKQPRFEMLPGDEPGGWMADNSKLKSQFRSIKLIPFIEGIRRTVYEGNL